MNCEKTGDLPPLAPGWKNRHRPSSPIPETPQTSANDAIDMMSLTGENGSCTSQRTPALSVSVGVMRHESCVNAEYSFILPARRRAPRKTYSPVASSSAAWPVTDVTRPVSSAKSSRASVS